jgi:hypothetical protein
MAIGYNESVKKKKSFMDEPLRGNTRYENDGFISYTFAYGGNVGWQKTNFKNVEQLERYLQQQEDKRGKYGQKIILKKPKEISTLG